MSEVPLFRTTFFAQYVDKSPDLLPGKFNESRSSLSVLEIFDKMALLGTYLGHLGLRSYHEEVFPKSQNLIAKIFIMKFSS